MCVINKRSLPRINVLAVLGELFDTTDEDATTEEVPQVQRPVGRLWKPLWVLGLWNAGYEPRCTPLHPG